MFLIKHNSQKNYRVRGIHIYKQECLHVYIMSSYTYINTHTQVHVLRIFSIKQSVEKSSDGIIFIWTRFSE